MADILCPNCNKPNPDRTEICQFCGTPLKDRHTEPLATIRPGEMPTKQKTSELESTLPGWLRDIRKGGDENSSDPAAPPPAKPEVPSPLVSKEDAPPLDFLAGLSQANDEEEAVPDWLAGLKTDLPSAPAPAPEAQTAPPVDWLADLQADSQPQPSASEQPATDWGFKDEAADEPAPQVSEETPDWLAALKAQDTSINAPAQPKPVEPMPSSEGLPDWLNDLESSSAPAQAVPTPVADDLPSSGDLPDWLSDMDDSKSAPPAAAPAPPTDDLPIVLTQADEPSGQVFPDWLANLGGENLAAAQPSQQPAPVAPEDSSSAGNLPDWLAGLTGESPKAPEIKAPPEKPAAPAKKAFSTGALEELAPLDKPDELPDWMAGLGATTPSQTPEPAAAPPTASGADAFDWLSGLEAQSPASPTITESKPAGASESPAEKAQAAPVSFDISTPEASTPAPTSDAGNAQNLDSIFSMEMPDWLSGFTPSEPEAPAKAAGEQPGPPSGENISPADLPSWVQAMRPIESVMSGAQGGDEDQTMEKEGPLAGLRSVLPTQENALGLRKPKAYSIKLQVDSTQMAQAALLEKLIASEAESRPVSTPKRVVNIRPLRWIIAAVLLLAVLVPATLGLHFFSLPTPSEGETTDFYNVVEQLPDAAAVLVVFDYQPGYAGEMEQVAGPVIEHLMTRNARLAFVSTSPTGVLMNEHMMSIQNGRRTDNAESTYTKGDDYADLGYLPGDAAGIQVFAEDPSVLGTDYQYGNLWTPITGFNQDDKKLSDFAAAIVFTDNPDTGRMWIEQTGQALEGKPLLMAVSAQAAPMIRPYYKSSQVKGLVSGLAGGALYEANTQLPGGNAGIYWDSYGFGMLSAELLILVGGVWALIQHLRMRRMEREQDEDEA